MTIAEYLRVLRHNWIDYRSVGGAGLYGALMFSLAQTPIYQAQSQMFVSITGASSIGDLTAGRRLAQQRVKSYAELVTSPRTLQPVIDQLSLPYSAEELAPKIKATSPLDTILIDVAVTDPSPSRARDIANAITRVFPSLSSTSTSPTIPQASRRWWSPPTRLAVTPRAPISPRTSSI